MVGAVVGHATRPGLRRCMDRITGMTLTVSVQRRYKMILNDLLGVCANSLNIDLKTYSGTILHSGTLLYSGARRGYEDWEHYLQVKHLREWKVVRINSIYNNDNWLRIEIMDTKEEVKV